MVGVVEGDVGMRILWDDDDCVRVGGVVGVVVGDDVGDFDLLVGSRPSYSHKYNFKM